MAAINESPAEAAFALDMLVEMHPCGVLEQAGGKLMLGLLDGLAVDMIDLVAHRVIAPAPWRAGERVVVTFEVELGQGRAEGSGIDAGSELRHDGIGRRSGEVALIDHH